MKKLLYATRLKPISDKRHAADSKCPEGAAKPLSNNQKARLSMLARKAYEHQKVQGMTATEWRHEIAINKVGCRISEAMQKHWNDLKSTFEDLAGRPGKAFNTQLRAGDNKRRIALYKLTNELAAHNLAPGYAEHICQAKFKIPLAEASAKQIWALYFDITKRPVKR
jgi:hypothetical protein